MRKVLGVLLAGGQSSRMGGGDKCLRQLGDRTVLEHVIGRLRPQVDGLLLNANGPPERFARFGLPVAADVVDEPAGPLGGILTGMEWARRHAPGCRWIVSVPSDTPFLPGDLVARLLAVMEGGGFEIVCAGSLGRTHPVVGLWPVALAEPLREALVVEGVRKVRAWAGRYVPGEADFGAEGGIDPFFNVNRPDDLAMAEAMLRSG